MFLTQPLASPGYGLGVFITGPPFTNWHFVGAVTNELPSGVFRVRWEKDEGAPTACQLGVSIMPLQELAALQATLPGTELVDFGKQVCVCVCVCVCMLYRAVCVPGYGVVTALCRKG